MKKKNIKPAIFIGAGLILIMGFFAYWQISKTPATMNDKINIATSFYPVYFLASQIGGDLAEVTNLTPAGTEPHDYDLTAQDMIKIRKSRLLILNGGGLEAWEEKIKENLMISGVKIMILEDELSEQKIENDPHIWLSPVAASEMAEKIAIEIINLDPKNKDYYQSNLNILKTDLANLDGKYRKGLEKCEKRNFITSHKAFDYLAEEYGLKQISIAGFSPEEEPSPRQLAEVSGFAKENEIKYIFFESLVSPKLSQVIADEIGAQTLVLNPIEGLSEEEISRGKNYITEMEKNLENLRIALECGNN